MPCTRVLLISLALLTSTAALAKTSDLPDHNALGAWQDTSNATNIIDVSSYPDKAIKCGSTLYPSHPQQSLKEYHVYSWASYDSEKVKTTDRVCLIAGKGFSGNGEHPCLRADTANNVILSDVFVDACGELYRGFEEITFLQQDETMGTLFSPGRMTYPKPNAEFKGEVVYGGTRAVARNKFLKIGPPFPGDKEKVAEALQEAADSFSYDPHTHLFIAK